MQLVSYDLKWVANNLCCSFYRNIYWFVTNNHLIKFESTNQQWYKINIMNLLGLSCESCDPFSPFSRGGCFRLLWERRAGTCTPTYTVCARCPKKTNKIKEQLIYQLIYIFIFQFFAFQLLSRLNKSRKIINMKPYHKFTQDSGQ